MNFKKLEEEARKYFDEKGAHDFSHTKRVLKTAIEIAKTEKNVDMEVLKAACLLHDIGRKKKNHSDVGARMAPRMLKKFDFPKIDEVVYAIKVHSKSKGIIPKTIEAKILQDADRIDLFGAIGIARSFKHFKIIHTDNARRLRSINEYKTESALEMLRSLLLIKKDYFNTKYARKIIKKRLIFIKQFVDQFDREWNSKDRC